MSYERIGDTHWHNGQKYTLIAKTERHTQTVDKKRVPNAVKLNSALGNSSWKIDNVLILKYKWELAKKKDLESIISILKM